MIFSVPFNNKLISLEISKGDNIAFVGQNFPISYSLCFSKDVWLARSHPGWRCHNIAPGIIFLVWLVLLYRVSYLLPPFPTLHGGSCGKVLHLTFVGGRIAKQWYCWQVSCYQAPDVVLNSANDLRSPVKNVCSVFGIFYLWKLTSSALLLSNNTAFIPYFLLGFRSVVVCI